MNVCIVTSGYPPEDCGGIGTYTRTLAAGLAARGESVVVISKSETESGQSSEQGVQVHRIKCRRYIPVLERFAPGVTWSLYVMWTLMKLRKHARFDVVEFPNWEAPGLLSQIFLRGLTSVVRVHTPYFETLELDKSGQASIADRMICFLEKKSCRMAKQLVSSTINHAALISEKYAIDISDFQILPLGVEDRFSLEDLQSKLDETRPDFRVLYVSRLESRKGTIILVDALRDMLAGRPNVYVDIVGRDRPHAPGGMLFKEYFEKELSDLTPKVRFHGFMGDEELADLYRNADLFIVPSLYESFGLIYVEAMMYGLPSIATGGGGISEVVSDGLSGILLKAAASQLLSTAFESIYESPMLLREMSIHARRRYEQNFSSELMVGRTQKLYMHICEST